MDTLRAFAILAIITTDTFIIMLSKIMIHFNSEEKSASGLHKVRADIFDRFFC